ncbi:hypothetical protein RHGRI_011145 [Rhododendron griersonianum]|uniref:BED-type domain-containing protein n=1 Tax=Rhododendron griersonianum TaxID=479676 RepID=A0AAV6KLD6_9ERIC|nr:hypothetical protein RHGRI_011145 [Rhododendron griersonianum]
MEEELGEFEDFEVVDESASSATRRFRCTTSSVWTEFDKYKDGSGKERAKCKRCDHNYIAGECGTSNLIRHLKKMHKDDDSLFDNQPLNQEIYRELLAKAIVDHNYSYLFVEHASNRRLHAYLNREVKFISRNTAKSIVGKVYQREKETLKHALELIPSKICLTSDLWSSLTSDEYMVLTAHYVDENWVLQKKILSFYNVPPPRNGAILADRLISLLKEWGIEKKIFTITLDNASYNDTMIANLKKHPSFGPCLPCNGNFFRVRCGAHILNLIVQDGLKVIDKVVHNIRESVKYVRGSDARKLRFVECLRELPFTTSKKVCQDMPTRWNSTYTMLEASLKHRSAFLHLSMIDPYYNTCPSEEEWNIAEKIARFLEPFFHITTLFSGSYYPTANLYFHSVWRIQVRIFKELESEDQIIQAMAKVMKEKFDKYWDCFSVVLSFAIILDPRYKLQFVEFCYERLYGNDAVSRAKILRDKLYVIFKGYLQHSTGNSSTMAQRPSCGTPDCDTRDDLEGFDTFTNVPVIGYLEYQALLDGLKNKYNANLLFAISIFLALSLSLSLLYSSIAQLMKLSDGNIVEMIFFPIVNEACRILAEGVAVKASDLDIASVLGMEFPAYKFLYLEGFDTFTSRLAHLVTTALILVSPVQSNNHPNGSTENFKVLEFLMLLLFVFGGFRHALRMMKCLKLASENNEVLEIGFKE